jgi:hypothetical protein
MSNAASPTAPAPPLAPTIHEATCVPGGVRRGAELTQAEAETRRRAGLDIVVCGDDTFATCNLARAIENAIGPCYHDGPHWSAGLYSLPHWQQRTPPPPGHSFYETNVTRALRTP